MSRARDFADLAGSADAGGLTGRNLIINGAMQVAQRGGTTTINNNQSYSAVDRFQGIGSSGGIFDITQSTTTPDGFKNSLKVEVTTADSSIGSTEYYVIDQRIEGSNIPQLAWGTSAAKDVTLSFWVRSSVTGTHGGAISNSATNRSYPYTYTISSADTWEHKSITIDGDTSGTWLTSTGVGIRLYWGLGAGADESGTADAWGADEYRTATGAVQLIGTANATWYITGVQLEVGEQATPFEHRSFHDEFMRCQRYYQEIHGGSCEPSSSTTIETSFTRLPMRATATGSVSAPVDVEDPNVTVYTQSSGAIAINNATARAEKIGLSNFSGLGTSKSFFIKTSGGHIQLDAEL